MRHLDTNIASALINEKRAAEKRAAELQLTRFYPRVAVSAIALAELWFGVANSTQVEANTRKLNEILQDLEIVNFDQKCANAYGTLRKTLRTMGREIPDADMFIAATAMAHNAILVTHNTRHFENIEGLQLEDWLA